MRGRPSASLGCTPCCRACSTAGAGQRHTLSSQNIPFLGRLIDQVTGGNIFLTDLYFVTMKPIYDLPFGGELGYMEDPLLGEMVTPRIYGKFAIQILDPQQPLPCRLACAKKAADRSQQ